MSLKVNRVKEVLREGGVCFGTMLRMVKAPEMIPLCAAAGWDFVILDTEHYSCNPETISAQALVAKYEDLTLLVRVPDKLYHQVAQALDFGAEGLVLPRVENSEQVESILRSSKYFPVGHRGMSVSIFGTLHRQHGLPEYMEWANASTLVVIQVESRNAVTHIHQLVSVEGVDAVLIGPADLAQDLGIPGQFTHPLMEEAFQSVIDSCNQHGVAPGIHLSDLELVRKWVGQGMRLIAYQYDSKILLDASSRAVEDLRSVVSG